MVLMIPLNIYPRNDLKIPSTEYNPSNNYLQLVYLSIKISIQTLIVIM